MYVHDVHFGILGLVVNEELMSTVTYDLEIWQSIVEEPFLQLKTAQRDLVKVLK